MLQGLQAALAMHGGGSIPYVFELDVCPASLRRLCIRWCQKFFVHKLCNLVMIQILSTCKQLQDDLSSYPVNKACSKTVPHGAQASCLEEMFDLHM